MNNKVFRIFKYISIIFVASYCFLWLSVSLYIQKQLNDKFANQIIGNQEVIGIKFDNAKMVGFPFAFGYKLENFVEYNAAEKIVYLDPVRISFNFLKRALLVEVNGEKLAPKDFKIIGNILLSADFQYSNKLADVIKNHKNFELVNFFNNFRIYLSDTKIFHKEELIYDLKISDQKFVFKNSPYYHKLFDFTKNLPRYGAISNKLQISFYDKSVAFPQTLASPLHYNMDDYNEVNYDFSYETHSQENSTLDNFFKNAKLDGDFTFKHDFASFAGYINYNSEVGDKNKIDIRSKVTGKFTEEYKNKLSEDIIDALKNLEELYYTKERLEMIHNIKSNFKNFVPDLEKFGEIEFDIKSNVEYDLNNLKLKIDRLSLKNNLYEIFINNDALLQNDKIDHMNGVIALKQYKNLLNITMDYIKVILNNLESSTQRIKADDKYRKLVIKTIKSMSNYPDSESTDLYFDINVTKNSEKFGSVDAKFVPQKLYALLLKIIMAEAEANGIDVKEVMKTRKWSFLKE